MNNYDETTSAPIDASEFLGGNYLSKEDVKQPTVARITGVWSERLVENGQKKRKLVVGFQEFRKPLILNKTNTKTLVSIFGSNTSAWMGPVTVYVNRDVEFSGKTVGGIRLQAAQVTAPAAAPAQAQAQEVPTINGNYQAVA